uniref:Kelch-like protein 26 n=1 Tax=Cacopsylla melanoneura TaxID=428564 RepID=A0A8D8ZMU7_9HEMI
MARKISNLKPLQSMLNNHRFSDFTFLVNKQVFHACRCVVSAASDVFEAMLTGHFQEKTDKQIEIKGIEHTDSFQHILTYVYGHDLDFRLIPEDILCEILRLSQMYNLQPLHDNLKADLDNLTYFHMGSVVALIHTAQRYELKKLYERAKTFLLENAKFMLQHDSFVNLEYEILIELLKSPSFHDKEINIFRGVLKWIHENDMHQLSDDTKKDLLIMDLFKQVRFAHISSVEYHQFKEEAKTGSDNHVKLFSKYKKILQNSNGELTHEPRVLLTNYTGLLVKFTIKKVGEEWDKCYFSPYYELKNLQWRLIVNMDPKIANMGILLDCKPVTKCEYWECVVDFSFKLNSKNTSHCATTPFKYSKTLSLTESQHGNKDLVNRSNFLEHCIDKTDNSFEIKLGVKPHDPTFTCI